MKGKGTTGNGKNGKKKGLGGCRLSLYSMRNYQKLDVWQNAYALTKLVFQISDSFPKNEEYGLKSHIRKTAVSVPSNIAEGYMRQYRNEYVQSLSIALGSTSELQTQLLLAKDVGFINQSNHIEAEELCNKVTAMLINLIKALKLK